MKLIESIKNLSYDQKVGVIFTIMCVICLIVVVCWKCGDEGSSVDPQQNEQPVYQAKPQY